MNYKLTISGRLPGLNEFIDAERSNKHMGAKLKKTSETFIRWNIRQQLKGVTPKTPVMIHYHYYEPNRRRDLDNVAGFAHKIVQDALVKEGVLKNDGWEHIAGFVDLFEVDKNNPRIEVVIIEGEEE